MEPAGLGPDDVVVALGLLPAVGTAMEPAGLGPDDHKTHPGLDLDFEDRNGAGRVRAGRRHRERRRPRRQQTAMEPAGLGPDDLPTLIAVTGTMRRPQWSRPG